ncbi:MAG: 50S ribosomal protein L25 [Desulfobulbaceae bacterium]|nr:50S ribosomal protein L25 [Desulfobulbaceae bacterium]
MDASVRTGHGKGPARTLRRMGKTPAVLYGVKSGAVSLSIDTKTMVKELLAIRRRNVVINLDVEENGQKYTKPVLIKEIQVDPLVGDLVHADFCEISLDKPLTLSVPMVYVGKAKGVDLGGEMHINTHSVFVKAKPLAIPDNIEVNVTGLEIGASITFADLVVPEGVTMVDAPTKICVAVTAAAVKVVEEDAAAKPKASGKKK